MKNAVFAVVFGAMIMGGCGGLDEGEETTEEASQSLAKAPRPTKIDALTRCVLGCLRISTDCKANQTNPSSSYFNKTDAECEAMADWCMKNHCTRYTTAELGVAQ